MGNMGTREKSDFTKMEKPAFLKLAAKDRVKEQNEFWKMYESKETNAEIEEQLNKLQHALRYFPDFKNKLDLTKLTPTEPEGQTAQPRVEHKRADKNKRANEPRAKAADTTVVREQNSKDIPGQSAQHPSTSFGHKKIQGEQVQQTRATAKLEGIEQKIDKEIEKPGSAKLEKASGYSATIDDLDSSDELVFVKKVAGDGKQASYTSVSTINYGDDSAIYFDGSVKPVKPKIDRIEVITPSPVEKANGKMERIQSAGLEGASGYVAISDDQNSSDELIFQRKVDGDDKKVACTSTTKIISDTSESENEYASFDFGPSTGVNPKIDQNEIIASRPVEKASGKMERIQSDGLEAASGYVAISDDQNSSDELIFQRKFDGDDKKVACTSTTMIISDTSESENEYASFDFGPSTGVNPKIDQNEIIASRPAEKGSEKMERIQSDGLEGASGYVAITDDQDSSDELILQKMVSGDDKKVARTSTSKIISDTSESENEYASFDFGPSTGVYPKIDQNEIIASRPAEKASEKMAKVQSDELEATSGYVAISDDQNSSDELIFQKKVSGDDKKVASTSTSKIISDTSESENEYACFDFGPRRTHSVNPRIDENHGSRLIVASRSVEKNGECIEGTWDPLAEQALSNLNVGLKSDEDLMWLRSVKIPSTEIPKSDPFTQELGKAEGKEKSEQLVEDVGKVEPDTESANVRVVGLEVLEENDQLIFKEKVDADGKKMYSSRLGITSHDSESENESDGFDFGPEFQTKIQVCEPVITLVPDEENPEMSDDEKTIVPDENNAEVPDEEDADVSHDESTAQSEKSWTPAEAQMSSILNIGISIDEDIMRLREVKIPDMDICPFNDGKTGRCFKKFCFKKHPITGVSTERSLPTFGKSKDVQEKFYFKQLPKKRVPGVDAVFYGRVSYSHSPYEFFILPDKRFSCDCVQNPEVKDTPDGRINYAEYFNEGQFAFDELMKDLHIYMSKHYLKMQRTNYAREEIVCCRSSKYGWARGVVLNDADVHDKENDKAWVFLIDIGVILEFGLNDLAGTIKSFIQLAPLVYRCSLFGVTCVGRDYSNPACDFFERLFKDNRLVCIENLLPKDGELNREFMEKSSYLVDLTIKIHGRVFRVAEILAHFHFAFNANPFPFRPSLITSGAITLRDALILRATGPDKPSQDLLDLETRRFQRFCDLNNVDVCGNPIPQEEDVVEFTAEKKANIQDWLRKNKK